MIGTLKQIRGNNMSLTKEEHKKRHIELHKYFDELFADFIQHHPKKSGFLDTTLKEFMEWSYQQTLNPTEVKK